MDAGSRLPAYLVVIVKRRARVVVKTRELTLEGETYPAAYWHRYAAL